MYTIAEVAAKFNISKNALRYYENEGLLPPIARDDTGIRHYSDDDLEAVNRVIRLRQLGASVKETGWFNEEFSKDHPDYDEGLAFLARLEAELNQKIAEIEQQQVFLNHKKSRLTREKAEQNQNGAPMK